MFLQESVTPLTRLPDYHDPGDLTTGYLDFDMQKCRRCRICTRICPARSIAWEEGDAEKEGAPKLRELAPDIYDCVACGDCLAACPEGAISITRGFAPRYYYQRLSQSFEFSYPRLYQPSQEQVAENEAPSPDPQMINPRYGIKQQLRMNKNKLKLLYSAIVGSLKFLGMELRMNGPLATISGLFKRDPGEISWADLLEYRATHNPGKKFLMYGKEAYTYESMNINANKFANFLYSLNKGPGQGLGIFMKNSPRYLDAFFGTQKIGMYTVTINHELKGEGLEYVLNHSDISALLIDAELLEQVEQIRDRLENIDLFILNDVEKEAQGYEPGEQMQRLGTAYAEAGSVTPKVGYNKDDICMLMYTSGTTGPPKGVVYRYDNTSVKLITFLASIFLKRSDVYYTAYPLCHGNALLTTVTMAMGAGATVALERRFSASRFWEDIRKYKVTIFNTIGSIIPILMKQPERDTDRQHEVRVVVSSGCPADMWRPFEKRFGVTLYETYGAIDGGGKAILNFGTAPVGSLGKPPKFTKYRLMDESGQDVPLGVPGELVFQVGGTGSRVEYYKNPEASQKKCSQGLLHTGDLVKQDRKGYLYFVGRKTDSMRKGGENISAYEVEKAIMDHPAIEEVAVYPVPSELAEDEIMAAIKLVGGKSITANELWDFLSDRLARYAVPRYIRFVDDFPKTSSHRIIKRKLENQGIVADAYDREAEKSG